MRIQGSVVPLLLLVASTACATHVAAHRSQPPVSVVVSAAEGVDARTATRMRALVVDAVGRNVRDAQPLLVSIALRPRTMEHSYTGSRAGRVGPTFLQVTQADYALTDVDGFVLDSGSISMSTAEVGYSRLEPMHLAADTIATHIAALSRSSK